MIGELPLKVFLAGRVALETNGVVIDEERFQGRQGRVLFAYLVAEQGRAVPRDELAEAIWGEALPATWDKALTGLVSKLRALLVESGVDGVAAERALQEAENAVALGDLEKAKAAGRLTESLVRQPFVPGDEGPWVE